MPLIETDLNDLEETCDAKSDLHNFDSGNLWNIIYERLKNRSTLSNKDASCDAARAVQNRWKNRYRDISPYDDTRVFLSSSFYGDYINANYVEVPEVPMRKYILTQGPMQQTASHFWLMVWERRSPAIIMLNRIFEKGTMRCYPYFPYQSGPSCLTFVDVDLCVRLEQETDTKLFVKRLFEVSHLQTNERHHVIHLHYTSWPDFGVPSSPSGMLNFLWAVRATGVLSDLEHPAIVHCSAGVGRSGAFVLIDLALCLVEMRRALKGLDLGKLFLDLRRCRMGIIQTADQLRFCYSAVVRGADELLKSSPEEIPFIKFERGPDEAESPVETSDSDDGWEGLGDGEYDSSVDEFDQVDEEVDLEEELEIEEDEEEEAAVEEEEEEEEDQSVNMIKSTDDMEIHHRLGVSNPNQLFHEHSTSSGNSCSWVSNDTDANTCQLTSSVGVGPDSHQPTAFARVCQEHFKPAAQSKLSPSSSPVDHLFFRSNRSNNALPVDDPVEVVRTVTSQPLSEVIATEQPMVETGSRLSNESESVPSKPDGDSAPERTDLTEPRPLERLPSNTDLDPVQAEYVEAMLDLRLRREARRQRQARMRERIEQTRQRMRAADFERKRWIPARLSRYMRRFFAESGLVRSTNGAILSSVAILSLSIAVSMVAYNYVFG
ncbi:Tyrosine-protein phosphatase non-receptor type 1 [Paragonimus heterotremus]|uniref:protein-tyrosine-phosphatase n=1 Tax=Paragonimus heterotremus TaxID=100268 RepID=A0A8J4WJL2_9TREM|nr:Tyrosine-protein phosphatase non-receptor type 1 [Paragonimus heterotremus]